MDNADHVELTGDSLAKAKNALEMGKAAVDRLVKDCKTMIGKIKDKNDDLYESLRLGCIGHSKPFVKSEYIKRHCEIFS